ncbi:MAG: 3'-5' exonuclease [Pseudoalteromonas sp.]
MRSCKVIKRWFSRYLTRKQLLAQDAKVLRYIVIDLELTGFDAKQHEIVSIAWLAIEQQCIKLSKAQHYINKDVKNLAQSPVYHGIGKQDVINGQSLKSSLAALAKELPGTILVFHNAGLDWPFLKRAFKAHDISAQPQLVIDTFHIEKKRLQQQGLDIALDDLTLNACRARYQLPRYSNHHALTDATATAELLLAQCHQICGGKRLQVKQLV